MTKTQQHTANKIRKLWPEAEILSHDAGCYYAIVPGIVGDVSPRFPHPQHGVCIAPSRDGRVEIQF